MHQLLCISTPNRSPMYPNLSVIGGTRVFRASRVLVERLLDDLEDGYSVEEFPEMLRTVGRVGPAEFASLSRGVAEARPRSLPPIPGREPPFNTVPRANGEICHLQNTQKKRASKPSLPTKKEGRKRASTGLAPTKEKRPTRLNKTAGCSRPAPDRTCPVNLSGSEGSSEIPVIAQLALFQGG
jgi:hypothetical protein